jgi:hypothetical protein
MVRILGSPGRSRRLRVGVALAACTALVMLMAVPALAVHDLDFELDGNIAVDAGGPAFDWVSFFNAAGEEDPVLPDASRPGFDASGFDRDFNTNANGSFSTSDNTTFATGSKDTLPITPGWQCNTDNNVLSKSDVMNAYAASYVVQSGPDAGDEVMYFALERNANTGTGNVGFWFLQDGTVGCVSGGGSTAFTGDHVDGDLLIVSEFSQGGTVSTIFAYAWSDALGTVDPNPVAQGASCTTAPAGDDICARVNTGTLTGIPWLTANKQDGVGHSLRVSEFFEGGINLTDSQLGGKCFTTFIGDTRSSTSLTATIFDFSLGSLGGCESELTTDPSVDGSVSIGANASVSVTDNATLTVDGADEWSGTLSFFLCGPLAAGATCDTGGVPSGVDIPIDQDTVQPVSSSASTVTEVGRYCWRGEFNSATDGVPDDTDASEGECFNITPVTPTLTTSAGADVVLGNPITDTATLTGTARQPGDNGGSDPGQPGNTYPSINADNGALANGTITFSLVGPGDCVSVPTGFTDIVVTVDGDSDADTSYTASFTPSQPGEYTWIADYSGDSPNTNDIDPTGCPDANEAVIVTGEAALSTAQDWLPNDTATITGPTALSGTATFTLFTGTDCGAGGDDNIVYGPVDVPVSGASPQTATTSNTTVVVEAGSGGYSWLVSYDDAVLNDPADTCEVTTITIDDTP